ncbi:hypothetical protein DET65_4313 [Sunxiuqinia elliptica]|uniref:Uncharacterized protein n=1 Tax=Sunxiuqinia elliptica TaxID=655355 RepID=A0A4R6GNG8_9BACT|nr:hypothetical protein DET52_11136 [Sunxiuqinia elliptica]TDO55775.1 hypothetical protein DET65_4313 [Sunxiuqinia elliptica]
MPQKFNNEVKSSIFICKDEIQDEVILLDLPPWNYLLVARIKHRK